MSYSRANSLSRYSSVSLSIRAEVTSFHRAPTGPRFTANRGALPTRLNDMMPNDFCRVAALPSVTIEDLSSFLVPNGTENEESADRIGSKMLLIGRAKLLLSPIEPLRLGRSLALPWILTVL